MEEWGRLGSSFSPRDHDVFILCYLHFLVHWNAVAMMACGHCTAWAEQVIQQSQGPNYSERLCPRGSLSVTKLLLYTHCQLVTDESPRGWSVSPYFVLATWRSIMYSVPSRLLIRLKAVAWASTTSQCKQSHYTLFDLVIENGLLWWLLWQWLPWW